MKNILSFLLLTSVMVVNSFSQSYWKQIRPRTSSNHYYAVHMFDSTKIWGFGQAGIMIYSENFGKSWNVFYESGIRKTIYSVHFFDNRHGIVVGEQGSIYQTSDQCKTWDWIDSHVNSTLKSVKFINSFGIAVGEKGTIIKSNNAGRNWNRVHFKGKYNFNSIFLLTKLHWFIVGDDGVIVETKTAGKTWKVKYHENKNITRVYRLIGNFIKLFLC